MKCNFPRKNQVVWSSFNHELAGVVGIADKVCPSQSQKLFQDVKTARET